MCVAPSPSSHPTHTQSGGSTGVGAGIGNDEREVRLLLTFCKAAKHFRVERVLGSGANGVVFAVKCVHPEAPFPDKTYALKVQTGRGHFFVARGAV